MLCFRFISFCMRFAMSCKLFLFCYDIQLVEMKLPRVLCTTLDEYKRSAEAASPHVICTYFNELRESHGIVLCRADVLGSWLSIADAHTLIERVHDFYTDPRRSEYVRLANRRSDLFQFEHVLDELGIVRPDDFSTSAE